MNQRRGRERRPLDFANPVDLIVDELVWRLRWAGRRVITGVVLVAGVLVTGVAFLLPLLLAGVVIAVFGLAVEPYKWLGSILIAVAFVVGIVAAPLTLRQLIRRSRRVIALTVDDEQDDQFATPPSTIVSPEAAHEAWRARIRAMDERVAPPPDRSAP